MNAPGLAFFRQHLGMIHGRFLNDPRGFFEYLDEHLDNYIKARPMVDVFNEVFELHQGKAIILSGGFGHVIADRIDSGMYNDVPYILVEGKIRSTEKVVLSREHGNTVGDAVFFDETIYGSKTFRLIQKWVREEREGLLLGECFVIYNGNPEPPEDVKSILDITTFYGPQKEHVFNGTRRAKHIVKTVDNG